MSTKLGMSIIWSGVVDEFDEIFPSHNNIDVELAAGFSIIM